MSDHKIIALVTGASAGIGAEYCRQLAERCDLIIAVGRREERLRELADELADLVEVNCIAVDLATIEGTTRVVEQARRLAVLIGHVCSLATVRFILMSGRISSPRVGLGEHRHSPRSPASGMQSIVRSRSGATCLGSST